MEESELPRGELHTEIDESLPSWWLFSFGQVALLVALFGVVLAGLLFLTIVLDNAPLDLFPIVWSLSISTTLAFLFSIVGNNLWLRQRAAKRFVRDVEDADAALVAGDFRNAEERYRKLLPHYSHHRSLAALLHRLIAQCKFGVGDLAGAARILRTLAAYPGMHAETERVLVGLLRLQIAVADGTIEQVLPGILEGTPILVPFYEAIGLVMKFHREEALVVFSKHRTEFERVIPAPFLDQLRRELAVAAPT